MTTMVSEKKIPWHEAPKGTTHYAPETDDKLASWYKLVGDFWYGINTDNAYMIETLGEHKWWQHGKTLSRPMEQLVERPKEEVIVIQKPEKLPTVVGFQVQNNNGENWNDRPSYEILTQELAVKDLVEARKQLPAQLWLMVAILENDIQEPTYNSNS